MSIQLIFQSQKSEMKLSSYSTTILSPVQEEPEEIQTSEDIPFTNITNKINELITFNNNEKLKSLHEISLNLWTSNPSDIIPSIEETSQQKIDENKRNKKERETKSQEKPLIVILRKAVPFISATQDKQIDVEDDPVIKYKKKKRKHSYAIAIHLLNVERFTIPPISIINFNEIHHKYNDTIEIKNEKFERSRLHLLKPMIKNFELDNNFQKHNKEIQNIDAYNLDKVLFYSNNNTKEIDQLAMFSEYIR
ncbi:unnamed protein product, partial [Rotaria sp. Silwood1]